MKFWKLCILYSLYFAVEISTQLSTFLLNDLSIRQQLKLKKMFWIHYIQLVTASQSPASLWTPHFSTQIQYSKLSVLTHSRHTLFVWEIKKTKEPKYNSCITRQDEATEEE